jgi:3-(methylthio)propanoyl-CoA dehydrogenase
VPIISHPDVRRMLMLMRAQTQAARAVAYFAAGLNDLAHLHPDAAARKACQAQYEYLVPIVKGWSTEMAVDVASLGVQVHGGMGYIEETGAAQHYRDARILPIYEGTTAIQANDLLTRKTARDGAAVARDWMAQMRATADSLGRHRSTELSAMREPLSAAIDAYERSVAYLLSAIRTDVRAAFAGSVPHLRLAGIVHGGWQMARAALAARRRLDQSTDDAGFFEAKIATARFFADHVLTQAPGLAAGILAGGAGALSIDVEQF